MKPPIKPPPLSIVETEPPVPTLTVQESPPAPTELARPPVHNKEFAATVDADGDWFLVVNENNSYRHLTETEARQVASIMNEQGSNVITLFCRTEKCKYKGTWIKRASDDVKKNVYFCEGCKQGMTR